MSDEKDQEKNVISLQEAKNKKDLKSPRKSKYQVYKSIHDALSGKTQLGLSKKFRVIKYPSGSRVVCLENNEQELFIAGGDDAPGVLLKYCNKMAEFEPRYFINLREANSIIESWRAASDAISPPPYVRFKNDHGLCFKRLSFDPSPGCTDTWGGLLYRLSNQRAFMSFIGSLFFDESYTQQYVWIRGDGGDGKGAIGRWFKKIFNQSFYMTASIKKNGFWMHSLLGKRICIFSDWSDTKFPTEGTFKSLTGGDTAKVEGKYKDELNVELNCKYIFFSNLRPDIVMQSADKRRIIYCDIKPLPEGAVKEHQAFEDRLMAESSAFIYECLKVYKEDCPTHNEIPSEIEEVDSLAGGNESYFQGLLDNYFNVGGSTTAGQMASWMERRKFNGAERKSWYEFIRNNGAKSRKRHRDRIWDGISLGKHSQSAEAYNSVD